MSGRVHIGTSGWSYRHWAEGVFYPHGLKPAVWLRFYSHYFSTVEINNTFYRLPDRSVFENWRHTAPDGFVFSLKASRFYTHVKRLAEPEISVAKLFQNAAGLAEKLGVILFQIPPHWGYAPDRLTQFLDYLGTQQDLPGVRAAMEIRDASWSNPECLEMLRQHNVALVQADQPGFTAEAPPTADFIFVRRHGPGALYSSNYTEEHLQQDSSRIRSWTSAGLDVYIYFNNDIGGYAVRNALRLKAILGQPFPELP